MLACNDPGLLQRSRGSFRLSLLTLLLIVAPSAAAAQDAVPAAGRGPAEDAAPADMQAARTALYRHQFVEARRLLEGVLTGDPTEREAAEAHRRLAKLAWRVRAEPDTGRDHLRRALARTVERSQSFRELARLERAAGEPGAARRAADSALVSAETTADSLIALVELSRALVADAERVMDTGAWIDGELRAPLARVRAALESRVQREPGLLDASAQLVRVGLLLDDGAAALHGWRSYYTAVGEQPGPIPAARRTLEAVLPAWHGPRTPRTDRIAAIRALASSGMIGSARALAVDPRLPPELDPRTDPAVADIVAYARFLDRARARAAAYYRATAAGAGDQWPFRDEVVAMGRELLAELSWDDGPPEPDPSPWGMEVWNSLAERFGTEVQWGRVSGVFGLRIGHRVVDDRRTVEQYGHSAELRFMALDQMVVDDYQTWGWDGQSMTGGWANQELVVQLRPGYADGGIRSWRQLQEPDTSTYTATSPTTASAIAAAAGNACPYIPGLASHLRRQGLERLRDSLRADGLTGPALRSAFLAAYDRASVETSIFRHEGRHAIDQRLGITESAELEFRAKLSQVAFAPFPRLALGSIISRNIGEPNPHGQANQRVLCGVVDWMARHAAEIDGLDPALPLLPQLPRLTDPQLREAFRSQDPLAAP